MYTASGIIDRSPGANAAADAVWRFFSRDSVAPTLKSTVPVIGSRQVAFGTRLIQLQMSEAVQQGQGTIEVIDTASGLAIAVLDASSQSAVRITSALVGSSRTVELSLPHAALRSYGLGFAIRLPTGFVQD